MPVQRFRSPDEAQRALWIPPDDPTLVSRIRNLWRFSTRLLERRIPRGLRRFATIEAANAERERWVTERVNAVLRERGRHRS